LICTTQADPENLFKVIELADALRVYDVQYHDGGTVQEEAIQSYKTAISLALAKRQEKLELGEETKSANVPEEMAMQYSSRSIDGILCAMYTSIGKVFFMSNMFENSEEYYTKALDLEPMYLDAMSARGSARLILGHYEDAAQDFTTVMENDTMGRFFDVYTGLSKILQARESAVPIGWGPIIESLNEMIPQLEHQYKSLQNNDYGGKQTMIAQTLSRLFHVLFLYNDVKTKDTDAAWKHLSRAYEYKMSAIPAWNSGLELQKIATTKKIFTRNFWPDGVGSQSAAPIFIIGFVRSGSTLLERVLDAHPQIVGTGENSVFNGRLDEIRNKIVQTSLLGDEEALTTAISSMADGVVDEMKERWVNGFSGDRTDDQSYPERFADKMLTNYYNVGFIHMLFPQALILHVIREPMDSIFSAYKHEFSAGTLDYTSDFEPLAELYEAYRELMDHWDRELPGRITHIRYEDMVHDMPGVAKKIIEATNLDWDDSILDFYKKKHAVNTLSTTQVRKGVYKDSLLAWRRYEKHLGPLLELVGERTKYDIKTSLPGYKKPPPSTPSADDDDDDEKRKEEPERGNSSEKTEVVDTKDEL
jgi:tetratricopeptide (TPR) repeat protein